MKFRYQTKTKIWVEFDAATCKEAVTHLSDIQNVFEEHKCGACGGTDLRFRHSVNKGFNFYELHCLNSNCRARLNFGQRQEDQELFPRRKDKDGAFLPNNGWVMHSVSDQEDSF